MPVNVCVIGSGSKGNCTAVWSKNTAVLIDAGRLSARYIKSSLSQIGLDIKDIDAVLITHCHTDHFSDSTYRLCHPTSIPVYCSVATWHGAMRRRSNKRLGELRERKLLHRLPAEEFQVGDFKVTPFRVSHATKMAAGEPVGYSLKSGRRKVSYATDLGHVTDKIVTHIKGSDILVIESNHDVEMERNSDRHPDTIEWVLGNTGHLSNIQCAKALSNILKSRKNPKNIVLAHLSEDCNTPELALSSSREILDSLNITDTDLTVACQKTPTSIMSID